MADKVYKLIFTKDDGSEDVVQFTAPQGEPGEPGKTPVKGTDYWTEADKQEIAEAAAGLVKVPEATMKPLTFTGAVNATYDGSEAVSVEIPSGGGGSGGGSAKAWRKIAEVTLEEDFTADTWMYVNSDSDGNALDLLELILCIAFAGETATKLGSTYYMADGFGKASNRNYAIIGEDVYTKHHATFYSKAIGFENDRPLYICTWFTQNSSGNGSPAKATMIKAGCIINGCGFYIPKGALAGTKYTVWGIDR